MVDWKRLVREAREGRAASVQVLQDALAEHVLSDLHAASCIARDVHEDAQRDHSQFVIVDVDVLLGIPSPLASSLTVRSSAEDGRLPEGQAVVYAVAWEFDAAADGYVVAWITDPVIIAGVNRRLARLA